MKLFGGYRKRSRKASLQLSINAIVILVMAMAVLGIGLTLIRGVLDQGKNKLIGIIGNMDISEKATSENPLTGINSLTVKSGKEVYIAANFYNNGHEECAVDPGAKLLIECKTSDGETQDFWDSASILEIPVPVGGSTNIGGVFVTKQKTGIYPCKFKVVCGDDDNPVFTATGELKVEY